MATRKACKQCRKIYEGDKCPNCGSNDSTTDWKGHVAILDSEKSEIAKNMKISAKGDHAVKTR